MILSYCGKEPRIFPEVFIAPGAVIIGDVEIGTGSSVWFNTVVRGDVNYIRIGERTNIQDLCILHVTLELYPLFVGSEVTVGHAVTLHGCRVGDRSLIGMGATIMDDVTVGEESLVGAGALVTEGTIIPPRSLVIGTPGRVKRQLAEEEVEALKESARHYASEAEYYRGALSEGK